MSLRLTRSRAAALVAGLIASASLVTISSATLDSASAACAPGVKVVKAKGKATGARVKATRPAVAKVGRKYVARSTLTATTGRGTVTLTQTICPNGTAGAAVQSTQSATARGTLTKGVTKKAATRKKAVKALKAAQKKAKRTLAAKAKRKSKKLALAAAKRAAATKAHHALYDSRAYWIRSSSDGSTLSVLTSPPAGAPTVTNGAGGSIVLNWPAGSTTGTGASIPCVTRAPAWPQSFVASATSAVAPALRQAADADDDEYSVAMVVAKVVDGQANSTNPFGSVWGHVWDGSSGSGVSESSTLASFDGPVTPVAGTGLCFAPLDPATVGFVATFTDPRVGLTFNATAVTGGVPVTLG